MKLTNKQVNNMLNLIGSLEDPRDPSGNYFMVSGGPYR